MSFVGRKEGRKEGRYQVLKKCILPFRQCKKDLPDASKKEESRMAPKKRRIDWRLISQCFETTLRFWVLCWLIWVPAQLNCRRWKRKIHLKLLRDDHWQAGSTHIRPKPVEPDGDFLWFLRANTPPSNGNISFSRPGQVITVYLLDMKKWAIANDTQDKYITKFVILMKQLWWPNCCAYFDV